MSEKQLLHEINSSREATEEIRKQVLQAKQKGYFSSTEFGRHFLSIFVSSFPTSRKNFSKQPARQLGEEQQLQTLLSLIH